MSDKKRRKAAGLAALVLFGIPVMCRYGPGLPALKGLILCAVLIWAGLRDLETREVPDFITVMIIILSFVGFEQRFLPSMIAGAAAVFIPQTAAAVIRPGSVGGADIKISSSVAFLLGAERGIAAYCISLAAAVITMIAVKKIRKESASKPFALVPFLCFGSAVSLALL